MNQAPRSRPRAGPPPPERGVPDGAPAKGRWWPAVLVVGAACVIAYGNSFAGAFLLDDASEIVANPHLARLLPPWEAMFVGHKLPARPLPYLSFALNRRFTGPEPWGFHAVNLGIHMVAAVALFDLVRLTLRSPRLADTCGWASLPLATAVAVIWAVHPLTTQAVTYIYQRIESMAAMFMLLALAACARWADATRWHPRGAGRGWAVASVGFTLAAMASKEHAVVLPLLILLYDWLFVATSAADLRRRLPFHGCVALAWLELGALVLVQAGDYQEFEASHTHPPLAYALTQSHVILHYLRLAVWPRGLCFEYSWPIEQQPLRALPATGLLLALVAIAGWGVWRRRPWAFPLAAFFLVLGPTSSILPVYAPCYEYRMYLPLAAVVALVVPAVFTALAAFDRTRGAAGAGTALRLGGGLAAVVVVLLAGTTIGRNTVYVSPDRLWRDTLAKRPGSVWANTFFATAALEAGDLDAALRHAERVVETEHRSQIFGDLGDLCGSRGDARTAVAFCRRDVDVKTRLLGAESRDTLEAAARLVIALANAGDPQAAPAAGDLMPRLERGLGVHNQATVKLMIVLAKLANAAGRPAEAEGWARRGLAAIAETVENPPALRKPLTVALAESLARQGRAVEAERLLRDTIAGLAARGGKKPIDTSPLLVALATNLATQGRLADARAVLKPVVETLTASVGTDHPLTRHATAVWGSLAEPDAGGHAMPPDPDRGRR